MIKKIGCLFILILIAAAELEADNFAARLQQLVADRNWPGLGEICADTSHTGIASYFSAAKSIALTVDGDGQLSYFSRFPDYAEIGKLLYTAKENKIGELTLKKGVSALKFIEEYLSYRVDNLLLRMGDATIRLDEGILYQAWPLGNFFVFVGEGSFSIEPGDGEEVLTLKNLTGKGELRFDFREAGFIVNPAGLNLRETVGRLAPEQLPAPALTVAGRFREEWGHDVPMLQEAWYLPFQEDFSAGMLRPLGGASDTVYRYVYNPTAIPDTTLLQTPRNVFLLYYNAKEGIKLAAGAGNELESMNLRLHFNPHTGYIAGTAQMHFQEEGGHKSFDLADGLMVRANTEEREHSTYILDDMYHLIGEKIKDVTVSYAGRLLSRSDLEKRFRQPTTGLIKRPADYFLVLSRDRSFYPNPGLRFFKSRVFVSHPQDMMCLVSGEMKSTRIDKGLVKSVFESAALKDLVLVCGRFEYREKVPGKIPIKLYAAKDLNLNEYFKKGDIQNLFAFLLDRYPALPISELNLLLSRGTDYGGISHPGLIHFNVVQTLFKDDSVILRRVRSESPVVFDDINKDNLIHELSHQWWGGIVSWKNYQDQWITEGLAQFSTLFYLQKTLPEKAFLRVLDDVRRWVTRKADQGPMVYGQRILNLGNDLDAFQSIVYNKGALLFMMFKDMLGEQAFLERIAALVENYRYQNLSSAHFIRIMADNNPLYLRFFNKWVFSRIIPTVHYRLVSQGRLIRIQLRQDGSDFVFPLQLTLRTKAGTESHAILVAETEQTLELSAGADIQSASLDTRFSPVRLEKD